MTEIMPETSLELAIPPQIAGLAIGSEKFITEAERVLVDSEISFQFADDLQTELKIQAKTINDKRLELTRPLDALKDKWVSFFRAGIDNRIKAASILQSKMSAYRRIERERAESAKRQAEGIARKEQERLEAEARKREADARRLKTEAARERALREAEAARQAAAAMPTSFTISASGPQTTSSNVAIIWKAEVKGKTEFLNWLIGHAEWLNVVDFKQAELNRLARQFMNQQIPGVRIFSEESFRTKVRKERWAIGSEP